MKPYTSYVARLTCKVVCAALLLAGCASLKPGRAATDSATVQGVADDYRQAQLQTEATEAALEGLAISPDQDLKQAFDYFTANLNLMEQAGKRLTTHANGMFYRGTYYFVESGKSLEACAFPRSGRTDDLRTVDLGKDFYVISEAGGEIKRAFRAYQFDIEQIHDFLANDLTPIGVDAMEQMLRKAKVDSDSLQQTLRRAVAALEQAKVNMAREGQKKW
jgi:hypothetical protein